MLVQWLPMKRSSSCRFLLQDQKIPSSILVPLPIHQGRRAPCSGAHEEQLHAALWCLQDNGLTVAAPNCFSLLLPLFQGAGSGEDVRGNTRCKNLWQEIADKWHHWNVRVLSRDALGRQQNCDAGREMRMKGKIVLVEEGKIQINSEQSVIKGEKTSGRDGERLQGKFLCTNEILLFLSGFSAEHAHVFLGYFMKWTPRNFGWFLPDLCLCAGNLNFLPSEVL